MNKEFIPYEQALELKELGFDEECLGYYNMDPSLNYVPFNPMPPFEHDWCLAAPLYQQAFRWFRDKHNMRIGIDYKIDDKDAYFYSISWEEWANGENPPVLVWHHRNSWHGANEPLTSYEESELACLKKLIEIVKNK